MLNTTIKGSGLTAPPTCDEMIRRAHSQVKKLGKAGWQ